jgi:hypothetical protein
MIDLTRRCVMRAPKLVLSAVILALAGFLVGCEPNRVELTATPASPTVGQSVALVLQQRGGPEGDLRITEGGLMIKSCPRSTVCATTVTSAAAGERRFDGQLLKAGTVVMSDVIVLQWVESRVTIAASQREVPVGQVVTLTATATTRTVAPDTTITIFEDLTQPLRTCIGAATCAVRVVEQEPGIYAFRAVISRPGGPEVESNLLTVQWFTASTSTTMPVIGTPEPPPVDPGHPVAP